MIRNTFRVLIFAGTLLFSTGCVTPLLATYPKPPGIFVHVPPIPLEAGIQLRQAR